MKKAIIGTLAVIVLIVVGLALWLFAFGDNPEEVDIDAAVEQLEQDNADDSVVDDTVVEDGSDGAESNPAGEDTVDTETGATETGAALENIEGAWSVQADSDNTFVGYRINEVLTTIGAFEVVARTPDVTGTLNVTGTTIDSVEVTAQVSTLTTDNPARDNAIRSQALETDAFPTATFSLTEPIELDGPPVAGQTFSVEAIGDLTIHGLRNNVTFPLDAQVVGEQIVVVGQLNILLDDYQIDAPSAPVVASVEDNAILELSVVLGR